eukprot:scaffold1800_cov387-Prasinococcus_capsulatus_cf.AAC.14
MAKDVMAQYGLTLLTTARAIGACEQINTAENTASLNPASPDKLAASEPDALAVPQIAAPMATYSREKVQSWARKKTYSPMLPFSATLYSKRLLTERPSVSAPSPPTRRVCWLRFSALGASSAAALAPPEAFALDRHRPGPIALRPSKTPCAEARSAFSHTSSPALCRCLLPLGASIGTVPRGPMRAFWALTRPAGKEKAVALMLSGQMRKKIERL